MTFGSKFPLGFTFDADGNVLTFKDSDGQSFERTYDANGYELPHNEFK
jgi:hypothetical protein